MENRLTPALVAGMVSRNVQIRAMDGCRDNLPHEEHQGNGAEVANVHNIGAAPSEDWPFLPLRHVRRESCVLSVAVRERMD